MEAYQRTKEQNAETFKRVGWRQLYILLLERGWFNDPAMSPLAAIMQAKFENAVALISIENASL